MEEVNKVKATKVSLNKIDVIVLKDLVNDIKIFVSEIPIRSRLTDNYLSVIDDYINDPNHNIIHVTKALNLIKDPDQTVELLVGLMDEIIWSKFLTIKQTLEIINELNNRSK